MEIKGIITKITNTHIQINIPKHRYIKKYKKKMLKSQNNITYLNYRYEFKLGDYIFINTNTNQIKILG